MATPYSADPCGRVWAAWQNGEGSQRALAGRFAVSLSFVRDLSRRLRESGGVAARPHGGGRRPKADPGTAARPGKLVAKHNDLTLDEYHRRLRARVSRATVDRLLLRLGLTRKKDPQGRRGRLRAGEGSARRLARAGRRDQARGLRLRGRERGHLALTRLYARAPLGSRAFGHAPRNWGDNVTILSALGVRGPLATRYPPGAADGRVFLTYLRDVLAPKLWKGAVVVMDNLGARKVKGGRELSEGAGARRLYLPPHSPDLNPIEPAWSQFKSHLRKVGARTLRDLRRAIRESLARIRPAEARAYFKHCGYCG